MKILIVTDIDNPGLKEDCLIAKSFIQDGHHVTITRQDYEESLDDLFDVIILRNIWHLDSQEFLDHKKIMVNLRKRLKTKKIPTINLLGRFDDFGKLYLKDLYEKKYPVIPTAESIKEFSQYHENDLFLLKPINGYDGFGIKEQRKNEIKEPTGYIIQPKIHFTKEIEFYFLNKEFQYALEFVPSKRPIYPTPSLYDYTEEELAIAQSFANLCSDDFVGVQRIDFLKADDHKILLLEIGDSSPYLNLNSLDKNTREVFLKNYKKMVYEYCMSRSNQSL